MRKNEILIRRMHEIVTTDKSEVVREMIKTHDKRVELASRYHGDVPTLDPLIRRKLSTDLMVSYSSREEQSKSRKSIKGMSALNS